MDTFCWGGGTLKPLKMGNLWTFSLIAYLMITVATSLLSFFDKVKPCTQIKSITQAQKMCRPIPM